MAKRSPDQANACQACRTIAENKRRAPPCEECGHAAPSLPARFQAPLWLLQRMGRACRDGMGGIDAGNILALLQALGVPGDHVGETAIGIIEILTAIDEHRNG